MSKSELLKKVDAYIESGIPDDVEEAERITYELYQEARPEYCMGHDEGFAEIALREAEAHARVGLHRDAMFHFLEAEYAFGEKAEKSSEADAFTSKGSRDFSKRLAEDIESVKAELDPDFLKEKVVTRSPYWLFDLVRDDAGVRFEIFHLGGNRYELTGYRLEGSGSALIVSPELECAGMMKKFTCRFTSDAPVIYEVEDLESLIVDRVDFTWDDELAFYNGETRVFLIPKADYELTKDDFCAE
ncbi:MAG: hypothetical protein K5891_09500 [Lachnospiraceae bacterium]|nr:hypothetical protein [Lachnospiraceae bacterium]